MDGVMIYYEDIELLKTEKSRIYTIEKDEIINFAKQWDPQPFHIDEVAAAKWPLGLTASGIHLMAITNKLGMEMSAQPLAIVAGLGWDELRIPKPVRPGDQLHAIMYVEKKRVSNSKPNLGLLVVMNKLINQDDEVVLSYKTTSLIQRKPVAGKNDVVL